jgi:hypothetical protein
MHLSSRSNWVRSFAPALLAIPATRAAAATAAPTERNNAPWQIQQFAWESGEAFGWERIGTHVLVAIGLSILLLWPFARIIAGPKRVLAKTTLLIGCVIALTGAFLALACFLLPTESIILLGALGVLYVAILVAHACHIFGASRGAAAGVLGCYAVVAAGAAYATEQLIEPMPWTQFLFKTKEQQGRAFASWRAGKEALASVALAPAAPTPSPKASPEPASPAPAPAVAATVPASPAPAPAPAMPAPDLQALYAQLQKSRAELDPNDAAAVARLNEQIAAYNQEKAIAAALAVPRAVPAKAATNVTPGSAKAGQSSRVAKTSRQ